jgi:hypothetical protein
VSDGFVNGLGAIVLVGGLTAIYLWYQHDQRKWAWIHELYWARNRRLGRYFKDAYDGEVESAFNRHYPVNLGNLLDMETHR